MKKLFLLFLLVLAGFSAGLNVRTAHAGSDSDYEYGWGEQMSVGVYGSAAYLTEDKQFEPGGSIELYTRYRRWLGGGMRIAYHRLRASGTNWIQAPQFFTDFHFLKPDSRFAAYLGTSAGYTRFKGYNAFDLSFRLGTDFWVARQVAISVIGTYSFIFHSSNQNSDSTSQGLTLSGGLRYRF